MPFHSLKKRSASPARALAAYATLFFLSLLLVSCASPGGPTEEELERRREPAPDPDLALLVNYTLGHGYDITDPVEGRFRYIMLERTRGGVVDRRYFEVEITEEGPESVFFLLNTGSTKETRVADFPEKARKEAERFIARERARGADAEPIAIEKRLMAKRVYDRGRGGLLFSRGVTRLTVSDIFEVAHEGFTLFRFFGQRSRRPAKGEWRAADARFREEVERFLEAYRGVMK